MKTNRTKETRTASEAYAEHAKAIEDLMQRLAQQLEQHKAQQAKEPKHWGYAGDLEEVRSRLQTTVSFLANDEE